MSNKGTLLCGSVWVFLSMLSACSEIEPSRLELTRAAVNQYEAGHDDEALRLFAQAKSIPGDGNPALGIAHILLARSIIDNQGSDQLDGADSALTAAKMGGSPIQLERELGLYRQSILISRGDVVGSKAVLSRICDAATTDAMRVCARDLIEQQKEAAIGSKRRVEIEKLYLFARSQYLWTDDSIFLAAMIDGLGYIDFERAVALKEETIRDHKFDSTISSEFCEMVEELVTEKKLSARFSALGSRQLEECRSVEK